MPQLAIADLTMHYEEHGQPHGPPLVLLHGFTNTGPMWRPQFNAFGARYRLLVPDLRGHGGTANPAGLAAMNHCRFARDIIAFCRALGVGRAAFCGASSGAILLLTLGLEAPGLAAALVLAGGCHYFSEEQRALFAATTPDSFLREITRDPAGLQQRHTPLGPEGWRTVVYAFSALSAHAHSDDFPQEELRGLAVPTLIVHGDRDPFIEVARLAALYGLLPDAELCILPRTGHAPSIERPTWFNAIVLDFLERRLDSVGTK